MSLICWNCRGAGNTAIVRELCEFAIKVALSILCIVETQLNKSTLEGLAGSSSYNDGHVVGSSGTSGGIGVFWNNEIKLSCLG